MKRVIDNSAGCPGGHWTWIHPETGHKIQHSNFSGIRNSVKTFLRANNFPISSQFEEELEQNLCANGARCEDWEPPSIIEKMSTFARALYHFGKQWREPVVTAEVLQERREKCQSCNYFGGSTHLLRVACQRCGCSGLSLALASKHCPLPDPKW